MLSFDQNPLWPGHHNEKPLGVLGAHPAGMPLPSIWAEVNRVRRTSKRLMCSVLSGYEEFVAKRRGENSWVWNSDISRAGGGFDRSKRKFLVENH